MAEPFFATVGTEIQAEPVRRLLELGIPAFKPSGLERSILLVACPERTPATSTTLQTRRYLGSYHLRHLAPVPTEVAGARFVGCSVAPSRANPQRSSPRLDRTLTSTDIR